MLGAAFAASALGGSNAFAQGRRVSSVGLQLYTLRNEMAEDFDHTLARVAELGYREMEFAGYYGPQRERGAPGTGQTTDSSRQPLISS